LPIPLPSFKAYQAPLDLWPEFASNYYFGVAKKSTTRKFGGEGGRRRERESYNLPKSLLITFTIITVFLMVTLLTSRKSSSCRETCMRILAFAFPLDQVLRAAGSPPSPVGWKRTTCLCARREDAFTPSTAELAPLNGS